MFILPNTNVKARSPRETGSTKASFYKTALPPYTKKDNKENTASWTKIHSSNHIISMTTALLHMITTYRSRSPVISGPNPLQRDHSRARQYSELHCSELHYSELHYSEVHCSELHYSELHYSELHYSEVHCTLQLCYFDAILQWSETQPISIVQFNSMQCTETGAVHCNRMQCKSMEINAMKCNAMQKLSAVVMQ